MDPYGCSGRCAKLSQDTSLALMNLSLQEVDHILKVLDTMSSHDVARAREQITPGVVDHLRLVQKLRDYRYRLQ